MRPTAASGEVASGEKVSASGVEPWLNALISRSDLSAKAVTVFATMLSHPRMASYDSARNVSAAANVNVATVTRAAQTLGFDGWPALQREFRARYLADLSANEVAEAHELESITPTASTLGRDRDNLSYLMRSIDPSVIARTAQQLTRARKTLVIASGSYSFVGGALAHNTSLSGYDVRSLSDPAAIANALATLTQADVVIVISFWRLYESAVQSIRSAVTHHAHTVFITDAPSPALDENLINDTIVVPAEGAGFFPSLTVAMSVVQAIAAEVAAVDPEHTATAIADSEREWERMNLLHRRRPKTS